MAKEMVGKEARSSLYSISADGSTVTVPGGTIWYTEPTSPPFLVESFERSCFVHDGKSLTRAELLFRRDDVAAPWRFEGANWFLGVCH